MKRVEIIVILDDKQVHMGRTSLARGKDFLARKRESDLAQELNSCLKQYYYLCEATVLLRGQLHGEVTL